MALQKDLLIDGKMSRPKKKRVKPAVPLEAIGVSTDYKAKSFTVAEQFISILNLTQGCYFAYEAYRSRQREAKIKKGHLTAEEMLGHSEEENVADIMSFSMLAVGLLTQGILGFFLRVCGYKGRSMCYCCLWVIASGFNVINLCQVMVVHLSETDTVEGVDYRMITSQLYLLYNIPGCVIMGRFIKLLRHQKLVKLGKKDASEWDEEEETPVTVPVPVAKVKAVRSESDWSDSNRKRHHHHPTKVASA